MPASMRAMDRREITEITVVVQGKLFDSVELYFHIGGVAMSSTLENSKRLRTQENPRKESPRNI
jgi:hypothetical protein